MEELLELLKPTYEAIASGNWALGASLGLIVAVTLVRKYGSRHFPKWASRPAGFVLNYLLALGGTLSTAYSAGAPVDAGSLWLAAKVAAGGSVIYEVMRELLLPLAEKFLPKKLQWLLKPLKAIFDNASIKERAKAAGDKAVAENPPGGLEAVTGEPKVIN